MIKPIAFLTILFISLANASPLIKADGGKVQVDFYFQSLCPYCSQFIQKSLKIASQTKDFWKICDFNMYPYGNARRVQDDDSWKFTCQHGQRQCEGNLVESCAIKKYDFLTQGLPFIICLEKNTSNWDASGKSCAPQYDMDWDAIKECSQNEEGIKYVVEMAEKTQSLSPAHQYVPWIVVNNVHSSSYQNAIVSNMVKFVCSIYTGSQKIDACK